MKEEEGSLKKEGCSTSLPSDLGSQRVFKKSSPNNKLTLYLNSRDLYSGECQIDRLYGVIYVDPEYLEDKKIYGQITLTFRYGREDEEVMGLKFCNEAVMCLAQLYPPHEKTLEETLTPLQEALIKRLGSNAHAFSMSITHLAPPSVQLVPAKEYNGAPIGTSYDMRAYLADRPDDKHHRRSTVRMGLRVIQRASQKKILFRKTDDSPEDLQKISEEELDVPRTIVEKPFLLSDGKIELEACLDKSFYCHKEPIRVTVIIRNNSRKTVRRIKIFIVQYVDVCMFSNGKFKNIVALLNCKEECPISPWSSFNQTFTLLPAKGETKNWIALKDSFNKSTSVLASTVTCPSNNLEDRNIFAIYVSYYVKVKLIVSAMGGELSLKLPFTLSHEEDDTYLAIMETKATPEKQSEATISNRTEEVKVDYHGPSQKKNKNKISNTKTSKCQPIKNTMQEENEIIKCDEET